MERAGYTCEIGYQRDLPARCLPEALYRANAKYRPAWQPRYLCFPTARDLPRIGLAALSAEAFLVTPRPLGRLAGLLRHAPGHAAAGVRA